MRVSNFLEQGGDQLDSLELYQPLPHLPQLSQPVAFATGGDAVFVRILLLEAGGKAINRCVKCGAFFTSQRSTRRYCSPAHRDADRAARWRARNPERLGLNKSRKRKR